MLTIRRLAVVLALSLCAAALAGDRASLTVKPRRSQSLALEARADILRALKFLETRQLPDGSWARHPAITGLVVTAMLRSGEPAYGTDGKPVKAGLAYIRKFVQKDGGIYERYYANYTTSVAIMALHAAGLKQDRQMLLDARRYLLKLQADEGEGFKPADPQYGGFGYEVSTKGGMRKPDLSNLQWSIDAIKATEDLENPDQPGGAAQAGQSSRLAYAKAIKFLSRCQNLKAANDRSWAADDGGFVYSPYESKASETTKGLRSYGSMTYAGLKSMLYANLDKNDPRVTAAYAWICKHWGLDKNPELGQQGLFYYYHTLARALNAYGREMIADSDGKMHDWRTEFVKKMLAIQEADGSWQNKNSRWMEAIPDLVTAYVVLALNETLSGW